jgi:protein KRI1
MSKRKADELGNRTSVIDHKKLKQDLSQKPETAKKANLLVDSDSDTSSEDESDGGAPLEKQGLKINEEYAKRFEHNKKREELHRC